MNGAVDWVNARGQTAAIGPKARKAKVKWLGRPAFGIGALDVTSNTQAKALLASWNATDGANWIDQYGLMSSDTNPNQWFDRDGQVLAGFTKWWNNSGFTPKLPEPGTKGGIVWQDLTQQHLSALQQWALQKGVINPGQIPASPQTTTAPTDFATCSQHCNNIYGVLDPISLATCLAACAQQFPISVPQAGQTVPQTTPTTTPPVTTPTTTPPPPPATTTTAEKKTNYVPWIIGGLAVLGVGALVVAGAR